jgi:hypothetical protein
MKKLIAVALLLLTLHHAHAQDRLMLTMPARPVRTSALKVNGQLLSILGMLFAAGGTAFGAVMAAAGPPPPGESGRMAAGFSAIALGTCFAAGALHTVIGVPLWVAGAKREKQWRGYAQASGLAITF